MSLLTRQACILLVGRFEQSLWVTVFKLEDVSCLGNGASLAIGKSCSCVGSHFHHSIHECIPVSHCCRKTACDSKIASGCTKIILHVSLMQVASSIHNFELDQQRTCCLLTFQVQHSDEDPFIRPDVQKSYSTYRKLGVSCKSVVTLY